MAHINIIEFDGLFKITLDQNEWTGLTVNGKPISPKTPYDKNIQFEYVQEERERGPIHFEATARLIGHLCRPAMFMIGSDPNTTDVCMIDYSKHDDTVKLNGFIACHRFRYPDAKPSPVHFVQELMTGRFETVEPN